MDLPSTTDPSGSLDDRRLDSTLRRTEPTSSGRYSLVLVEKDGFGIVARGFCQSSGTQDQSVAS
jgi:hypothetical protein